MNNASQTLPSRADSVGRTLGFSLLAAGLMALSARVEVPLPMTPVPLSLQTFALLLSAALLGPRGALLSQGIYLGLGLAGLPVFASAALLPTAGYLVGFPIAAWIAAVGAQRLRSMAALSAVFIFASTLVVLLGSLWLKFFLHTTLEHAFVLGAVPFLLGDVVKSVGAAALVKPLLARRPSSGAAF